MNTKIKAVAAIACGVVACGLSQSAHASPNLVVDGGFETTTSGVGQLGYNTATTPNAAGGGWSYLAPSSSYDFIFNANHTDGSGNVTATGQYSAVSLFAPASTSPAGGNFLAVDPAYQNSGTLSETITGLIKGDTYTLSFYWAAAQQTGFSGATTEGWDFGLGTGIGGGTSETTGLYDLASHSFSGWMSDSVTITANATSEVLSFLAIGGPTSTQPPFDLLDGVSLTQNTSVPDTTSTAGLLGLGVVAMGVAAGCRRFVRA